MTREIAALRVRRLDPGARLPTRAHPGDAGLDLYALDDGTLEPGARRTVATGVAVSIPEGQAGLIMPRSGLAAKYGITIVNAPGLIDAGYRGEVRVLLHNTDRAAPFSYAAGDRVAQLVIIDVALPVVIEADALDDSARGAGGFGSSGS